MLPSVHRPQVSVSRWRSALRLAMAGMCLVLTAMPRIAAADELESLEADWRALAGQDAVEAHDAVDRLSRNRRAVAFLADRLHASALDTDCICDLVGDLDARDFRIRAFAERELRRRGAAGVGELRRLAETTRSAEVRARIQRIMSAATGIPLRSRETLRALRAIAVLERNGSRAARAVLVELAGGAPSDWQTEAACQTIQRLRDRPAEDTPLAAPRPQHEPAEPPAISSVLRPKRSFTCATHAFDAAFHPDGVHVAGAGSMGKKGVVKIWNAGSGQEVASLDHSFAVMSVSFSPDGRLLVAAGGAVPDGDDGGVVLWKLHPEIEPLHLASRPAAYYRAVFSSDARWMAAAAHDGRVHVWQTNSGAEMLVLEEHTGAVFDLAFSPDGRFLATVGGERYNSSRPGEVQVLELASGQPVLHLEGHTRPVFGVAFSPDSRHLATAAGDDTVRLWSVADGRRVATYDGHESNVYSVAFHPDGRHLASVGIRGEVRIWETATQRPTARLRGPSSSRTYRLAFSSEGTRLLAGGPGRNVHLWDVPAAALGH